TRATLRPYLVEEALELDQALRHDDPAELRDELGDLLLHLAFQIVIGEERHEPDAEAVTRGLEEEGWRRGAPRGAGHPGQDQPGGFLFAVVNLARTLEIDPRAALERANDKFRRRFAAVERLAAERGVEVGRASLEELDRLWDEVKASRP